MFGWSEGCSFATWSISTVELVVVMSMSALMVDRLRLSTANTNIVASQLVKLMMMVVIVNLYNITRLNITDCNIGGCGK